MYKQTDKNVLIFLQCENSLVEEEMEYQKHMREVTDIKSQFDARNWKFKIRHLRERCLRKLSLIQREMSGVCDEFTRRKKIIFTKKNSLEQTRVFVSDIRARYISFEANFWRADSQIHSHFRRAKRQNLRVLTSGRLKSVKFRNTYEVASISEIRSLSDHIAWFFIIDFSCVPRCKESNQILRRTFISRTIFFLAKFLPSKFLLTIKNRLLEY